MSAACFPVKPAHFHALGYNWSCIKPTITSVCLSEPRFNIPAQFWKIWVMSAPDRKDGGWMLHGRELCPTCSLYARSLFIVNLCWDTGDDNWGAAPCEQRCHLSYLLLWVSLWELCPITERWPHFRLQTWFKWLLWVWDSLQTLSSDGGSFPQRTRVLWGNM